MMRQDCLMHRWPFLLLVDESGGFTRFTPPFSQAKSSCFQGKAGGDGQGRDGGLPRCWAANGLKAAEIWAGHFGK